MTFSQRSISEFIRILKKLEDDKFDEDDILNLLLQIRAVSKKHHLIWEFASFVAHPEERNQGVFQTSLNVNYAKIKILNEKRSGKNFNPFKIEKNLFKTLIVEALKLTPDIDIKEKTGFSKSECEKIIKDSYEDIGNYLVIKNPFKVNEIWQIINPIINVLRMNPLFENIVILKQFKMAFKEICKELNLNFKYEAFINEKGESLLFCLMCLIHSSNFKFFDGTIGTCNLEINNEVTNNKNKFVLNLMANVKIEETINVAFSWSLMKIENIEKFIPDLNNIKLNYYKIDKFNAVRDKDNNLVIGNK